METTINNVNSKITQHEHPIRSNDGALENYKSPTESSH